MIDKNYIQFIFFIIILILLIGLYFNIYKKKPKYRLLFMNIIAILTTAIIFSGIVNIILDNKARKRKKEKEDKNIFIEHNNENFIKIYKLFLEHPKELGNLFYDFYGQYGFPKNNDKYSKKINRFEYIVINIIIENLITMFIIDNSIFENLQFRNKIINFIKSEKFKYVLARKKRDFPTEFVNKLISEKMVLPKDLQVENIDMIYKN